MKRGGAVATFAISAIALFMVVLDNLVVTTALPAIRLDLGASLSRLEWTVNAYTLTYAVLLLTGAAAGDRFGRKRVFMLGLGVGSFVGGHYADRAHSNRLQHLIVVVIRQVQVQALLAKGHFNLHELTV